MASAREHLIGRVRWIRRRLVVVGVRLSVKHDVHRGGVHEPRDAQRRAHAQHGRCPADVHCAQRHRHVAQPQKRTLFKFGVLVQANVHNGSHMEHDVGACEAGSAGRTPGRAACCCSTSECSCEGSLVTHVGDDAREPDSGQVKRCSPRTRCSPRASRRVHVSQISRVELSPVDQPHLAVHRSVVVALAQSKRHLASRLSCKVSTADPPLVDQGTLLLLSQRKPPWHGSATVLWRLQALTAGVERVLLNSRPFKYHLPCHTIRDDGARGGSAQQSVATKRDWGLV
jgi:hypothetical protein